MMQLDGDYAQLPSIHSGQAVPIDPATSSALPNADGSTGSDTSATLASALPAGDSATVPAAPSGFVKTPAAKDAALLARKERNRLAAAASRARKDAKLATTLDEVERLKARIDRHEKRELAMKDVINSYEKQISLLRESVLSLGGKLPPNLLLKQELAIFDDDMEERKEARVSPASYPPPTSQPAPAISQYSLPPANGDAYTSSVAGNVLSHPKSHPHMAAAMAAYTAVTENAKLEQQKTKGGRSTHQRGQKGQTADQIHNSPKGRSLGIRSDDIAIDPSI